MSITWTFRYRGDFAEISMEILVDFDMKTKKKILVFLRSKS
jgi:hypothetical protein